MSFRYRKRKICAVLQPRWLISGTSMDALPARAILNIVAYYNCFFNPVAECICSWRQPSAAQLAADDRGSCRGRSPFRISQSTNNLNDCHHAGGMNYWWRRCRRKILWDHNGRLLSAALDSRHFVFNKIPMPLFAADTGCMHGLGFVDVHETGCILQLAMAVLPAADNSSD